MAPVTDGRKQSSLPKTQLGCESENSAFLVDEAMDFFSFDFNSDRRLACPPFPIERLRPSAHQSSRNKQGKGVHAMKKMVVGFVAALSLVLVACTSVESAKVNSADIASSSDAVAVIQATELGFNLLWGFVPLADPSFDSVVNKSLIAEAKAMGGNKVEIVSMFRMNPDQFPFNFMPTLYLPGLLNFNMAYATGVAVK